ncbi:MAG: hypothetical protein ACRD0B_00595, partial [Acidimicrobiales bacterium]
TLEWATSSPPPHHNFYWIPPIRSERPLWDHNHPDHLAIETAHVMPSRQPALVGARSAFGNGPTSGLASPDGEASANGSANGSGNGSGPGHADGASPHGDGERP